VTRLTLVVPVVVALGFGQQTGRDRPGVPATAPAGTARIAGIVVEADPTATTIRRAILTLTGAELPRGRTTISDDQGRFVFEQLPAGRFTLTSTKVAYIAGAYGATRPGRPGVPLQIAAGQAMTDVRIAMARGAAISGALRSGNGEPAANVRLAIYRVPPPGAAPNLIVAAVATTDDRGVYRVFGLLPGTYLVASALPVGSRLSEIVALSSGDIDRALRELQQRTGLPMAGTPPPAGAADPVPPGDYSAAPIFYPGVAVPSEATPIVLAAGDDRGGVDFPVPFVRVVRIRGAIVYPPGPAPTVQFAIRTDGLRLTSLLANVPVFASELEPPGRTFTYSNVSPGRYVISVRTRGGDSLYARAEVDVSGADITGLTLNLQPTIALRGRVVFDGKLPAPAVTTIQLTAANGAGGGGSGSTQLGNLHIPPGVTAADGTFAVTEIIPDVYRLTTNVPDSSGWWLKSAVINGRDVLDDALEILPGGDVSGAVLTFSDRLTQLSGTLLTTKEQIAPNYFIAVFPANRSLWRPESRRIRSARAGTDGRWIVRGLPPGDYLVAALTDLDPDELRDPAFLQNLLAASVKVTLGDGERKIQDLRIGSGNRP
jgi:hypothetical protein